MKKYRIRLHEINMGKVCRLCLFERKLSKYNIFQTKIRIMIETCSSIKLIKDVDMPSRICSSCLRSITKLYTFKKNIEKIEKLLEKHFRTNVPKQNILDIAVSEAEIYVGQCSTRNLKCEGVQDNYSEYVHNSDENFSINLDTADKGSNINSNVKVTEIFKYYNEKVTFATEEYSKIHLVDNEDQGIQKTVRICGKSEGQMREFSNNFEVRKDIEISDTSFRNLSESQQENVSTAVLPLDTIQPKEIPENEIVSYSLPQGPPPLIPLKSIGDEAVLSSIIKSTPNLALKCSNCEKTFSTLISLKDHRLECAPTNSLICNICKKEFQESKKLIGHLKGHMVSKDYCCKICDKRYPNPSTLQIHIRTHTGERPFKCTVCSKGFTRWAGVVSHMQTHDDVRRFKCDSCDKSFKILSNLERHKILHSGVRPFCCNYCGKTFGQSDNLQLHIRTNHTNERPYLCSQCGKGFVSSTRLNRHMWVHSGYKPFRCNSCLKTYSNSSDLKNHERFVHGDGKAEKPLACKLCDMRFFHPCRLNKHLKTHQKLFACDHCNKTFSSINFLNNHVRSKHSLNKCEEDVIST